MDIKLNEIKEFNSIKNGIALKAVGKIILYTIISGIVLIILIDGVFNDQIAEEMRHLNDFFYYFIVTEKPIIITIILFIIVSIISFFVIRNTSNNLIIIISAMNQIYINPDETVKLPADLAIIENKLNNIRIELIKNRNEAKEAENKKNDLIMYMAHDLKTPLTSIIGYLTLLTEEKYISKPLQEKYMQIALQKAFRVEDLTNQFFEITKYNIHDMPINKQKINLSFLIDQLIEECYPMLQEKKLRCIVDKPDNVYFLGDGDKLARCFGNLIKNAINYSYENTNIEIKIMQDEKNIQIIFKNKGDKIPKYKLDKIFDKFYRVDESRKSDKGGAGLGLAITKEIVELHDGNIYVKNDSDLIEFYIEL